MFNLNKLEYHKLRKRVRKLTLVNSNQAEQNRETLTNRPILMGGIVLKKEELLLTDTVTQQSEVAAVTLILFDGSGDFEVIADLSKLDREVKRFACLVKVGQAVFFSGSMRSLKNSRGYCCEAEQLYSLEEMEFYKQIYPEKYEALKKDLNQIRKLNISETEQHKLEFVRSPMEAIRHFIRKSESKKDCTDCHSIEKAAYEIYDRSKDRRSAKLILKFYLKRVAIKMVGEDNEQDLHGEEKWKSCFFEMYPDLEGVIKWPAD